jgi:2,4-didehydro-3-deoxy-L-rhamnonate hydrolase
MKLIRFGDTGSEKPGVILPDGQWISTERFGENFDASFFANKGVPRLKEWVKDNSGNLPEVSKKLRLGPPVMNPGKIVCIGLNYLDHVKETNAEIPGEPILFFKATSSLSGPNDDVIIPRGSEKTDWEVELAVVIEKKASYVSEAEAMDYVAGYTLFNDYSERAFQMERGGQWVKGKSCDTFSPLGPYLATKEEIKDVDNLRLWLKVNGETKQDGNTSKLIFKIPFLVSYISQFMSLLPGDVISTGTPPGVGLGLNPPQYLKEGDTVELGIEGLGKQKQKLKKA